MCVYANLAHWKQVEENVCADPYSDDKKGSGVIEVREMGQSGGPVEHSALLRHTHTQQEKHSGGEEKY